MTRDEPQQIHNRDWLDSLTGTFRSDFRETIASLDLSSLQKYPPPKHGGLPFGHEFRIASRFLRGSCNLLDPSAFSFPYRLLSSSQERDFFKAFILGEPLSPQEWSDIIGPEQLESWIKNELIKEEGHGFSCQFRVVSVGRISLVVDPIDKMFPLRVHFGQDSLKMIEFLSRGRLPLGRRFLDVGPGAGAILLQFSRHYQEAIGLEINPRAVNLAKFNAELNSDHIAKIFHGDIFTVGERYGQFDLVTWNAPFMFFPESYKEKAVDGYGGEMGTEITLKFMNEIVSDLLSDSGAAYLFSASPVLKEGQKPLEEKFRRLAPALGLDVCLHVWQSFWVKEFEGFHDSHGIKRFESVIIEIKKSARQGIFSRIEAHAFSRLSEKARLVLYRK